MTKPVTVEQVLIKERAALACARLKRAEIFAADPATVYADAAPVEGEDDPHKAAYRDEAIFGLALSGGGIRSATFNLGILQALARQGLLQKLDYLSTNSGGGYIGSWLSAWICRDGLKTVQAKLGNGSTEGAGTAVEPEQIRWLRNYGNYLTPNTGLMSADTWVVGVTYVRNFLLNLLVFITLIGCVLLTARLLLSLGQQMHPAMVWPAAGLIAIAGCVIFWHLNRPKGDDSYAHRNIQLFAVVPVVIAAWMLATSLGVNKAPARPGALLSQPELLIAAGYLAISIAVALLLFLLQKRGTLKRDPLSKRRPLLWFWLAAVPCAVLVYFVTGWLLDAAAENAVAAGRAVGGSANAASAAVRATVFGAPLLIVAASLIGVLHIGLVGNAIQEATRQWWSRFGAFISMYVGAWLLLMITALYGPSLAIWFIDYLYALGFAWIATTISGVLIGKSEGDQSTNVVKRVIVSIAPSVFVAGLLVAVSLLLHFLLFETGLFGIDATRLAQVSPWCLLSSDAAADFGPALQCVSAFAALQPAWWVLLALLAGLAAICALLSRRVDINAFSLHHFYRSRLIRGYLGASHQRDRKPDPFTNFDTDGDDLALKNLNPCRCCAMENGARGELQSSEIGQDEAAMPGPYEGPYHLYNAALNLGGSRALRDQDRKAASFIFSPLYVGFEKTVSHKGATTHPPSYVPMNEVHDKTFGIGLGTAMAISGAAVSPNMGSQTSPSLAFLLTFFNVRLGWWFGNPAVSHKDSLPLGPKLGVISLVRELFGAASDSSKYVYLSDGGHFENVALYELVRRRCRYIIATDCGADPDMQLTDIANAIRKIRIDLGIEIQIDLSQISTLTDRRSTSHCAVGRIRYDDSFEGTLIYLKPTLTGNEPQDVQNYARENPTFPQQSTGDQWFSESQFESYRKLGQHIGNTVLGAMGERRSPSLEALFSALRQYWYPASQNTSTSFSRHAAKLDDIFAEMHEEDALDFMSAQIYPQWRDLFRNAQPPVTLPESRELPISPEKLKRGFYFCNSLIQLMENVYHDLDLEHESEHPDNRGWINLFDHWTVASMLRATWSISAATYGARFQSYLQRRFGLGLGTLKSLSEPVEEGSRLLADHVINWAEAAEIVQRKRAGDTLHVFQLNVEDPSSTFELIRFTFGFALVADSDLRYLRIQSHLRTMGLGRRALGELLDKMPDLGVEDLPETASAEERAQQRRLERTLESLRRERAETPPTR